MSAGSVNRPPSSPPPASNVSAVRPDPYFNPATFQADAAILVLAAAVPSTATAIALATTASGALYAPGTLATFSGWGETVADVASSAPTQLQSGTVPILANSACQAAVEFHPGYTLCTGGPGYRPATCHGDSGGPLVVTTASGPVQIGITSYGSAVGCGIAPDYFTRVSSVQTWIASAIAGAAPPPSFVPPFNAPAAPVATLAADGVSATFAAPAADPATLPTIVRRTLVAANGAVVSTQTLALTATSVAFPSVQPGTYTVSVVATYSEGPSTRGRLGTRHARGSEGEDEAEDRRPERRRLPRLVQERDLGLAGGRVVHGGLAARRQATPGPDRPELQGRDGGRGQEDQLPRHAARHDRFGRDGHERVLDRGCAPHAAEGAEDHRVARRRARRCSARPAPGSTPASSRSA